MLRAVASRPTTDGAGRRQRSTHALGGEATVGAAQGEAEPEVERGASEEGAEDHLWWAAREDSEAVPEGGAGGCTGGERGRRSHPRKGESGSSGEVGADEREEGRGGWESRAPPPQSRQVTRER